MAGSTASIVLTAAEYRRLTSRVRAGTTPQRLVRRARVVLGSASGLGSRALARREHMSRTTVRRWLAPFVAKRCDGLQDHRRSGRPVAITPKTRALVVALASSRPGDRDVPLSRYSLSELTVEVGRQREADAHAPSSSAI
jgi:transposase